MNWLRWHHGTASDPRLGLVASKSGQPVAVVLAVWVTLQEHASQSHDRGSIEDYDYETAAYLLGVDVDAVTVIMGVMRTKGMLSSTRIADWEARQPTREDGSAERARAWRERKKEEANAYERIRTHTNTDKNREDKIREDKNREDTEQVVVVRGSGGKCAPPTATLRQHVGTRLAEDWELPQEWRKWAETERPDLDVTEVARVFLDYWIAKPGKDGRKVRWDSTWRNWVRAQQRKGRQDERVTDIQRRAAINRQLIEAGRRAFESEVG